MIEQPPLAITLLVEIYNRHGRFLPEGVSSWNRQGDIPEWKWNGSKDYAGQDSLLMLFRDWSILEQQSFLECAVGHIISVLSHCHRTVVQIQGNEVSVKNSLVKEKRTFSEGCLLENLFRAVLKMIDVEWLPVYKSQGGDYFYTDNEQDHANHDYELALLKTHKRRLEDMLSNMSATMLPSDDPFANSPQHGGRNAEAARLAEEIQECQQQIGSKKGVISSLNWM